MGLDDDRIASGDGRRGRAPEGTALSWRSLGCLATAIAAIANAVACQGPVDVPIEVPQPPVAERAEPQAAPTGSGSASVDRKGKRSTAVDGDPPVTDNQPRQQENAASATPACPGRCVGKATPELERALQERGASTRRCYNEALVSDPSLGGAMKVLVRIADDGGLCQASALQSDMPDATNACVLNAFHEIRYPSPDGGCVEIVVPLRFVPHAPP
jgi:hypothetical protein